MSIKSKLSSRFVRKNSRYNLPQQDKLVKQICGIFNSIILSKTDKTNGIRLVCTKMADSFVYCLGQWMKH
jgi:hypothetical protein